MFKRVGIIGAGTMGSQLAALFAGAGCDVELMRASGRTTDDPLKRIARSRPSALYSKGEIKRIRVGTIDRDLSRIADCGWVIESIIERPEAKASVFARIEGSISPGAIFTSNTSAISCAALAANLGPDLARRFFVAHFFNPPRYLKLVELCLHPGTDEDAALRAERFLVERLGKGVVRASDTPGFIANRIGVFAVMDTMHMARGRGWPIEAVDTVMGRPCARPRQGVFRMLDMVGLDTVAAVSQNIFKGCIDDELSQPFRIPQFLQKMLVNGWLGRKSDRGFYAKEGGKAQAMNLAKVAYRPKLNFVARSLAAIDSVPGAAERLSHTVFSDDQAGEIAWPIVSRTLCYAASRASEIADDIDSIDRALRWGYNWELGPFEAWDALGVSRVAERLDAEGSEVPGMVRDLLNSGRGSFYEEGRRRAFSIAGARGSLVEKNESASLLDLGGGIFACEFHTKMNALDDATIRMLAASVERVERDGLGLLIANDGEVFSAGGDLKLIGRLAQQGDFEGLDRLLRDFQNICQRLRFCARPVVAVPFGRALGAGCEVALAACRRVAHIESYMGLVELSVGLIPSGSGCKNMLLRMEEHGTARGPYPKSQAAFQLIGTSRVSAQAREAAELGFLSEGDRIVLDRDELLASARDELVKIAPSYSPPAYRDDILLAGRGGEAALVNIVRQYRARGLATEYDACVAIRLARVLAGGDRPVPHTTCEQHILDLEREAFLSLAGEPRTQARIAHMLKTGKPLRN